MKFLLLIVTIFFIGCSSKEQFLLPQSQVSYIKNIKTQIGVKKIELPPYLNSDKIVIQKGLKVKELNAKFVTDADELFTKRAIRDLKKALNNPNVFLYPWDVEKKRGYIIEIIIDDFIYVDNRVKLKGSYFIKNSKNTILVSKNFEIYKPSNENIDDILNNMGSLFDELISQIAQKIAK